MELLNSEGARITNIDDPQLYRKSVQELFESMDKDGDGFVGANELRNYLLGTLCSPVLGHKPSKEEVVKMIEDADQSKKGVLSRPDFTQTSRISSRWSPQCYHSRKTKKKPSLVGQID